MRYPSRSGLSQPIADEDNPYWVSFSDIMAGLLVVFILATVALMLQLIERKETLAADMKDLTKAVRVRESIVINIQNRLREQNIMVEVTENESIIRIPEEELNFKTMSYDIPESQQNRVRIIGKVLFEEISFIELDTGRARSSYLDTVFVEGHTDNRPTSEAKVVYGNWGLSALRALSLWKYWDEFSSKNQSLAMLKNHNNKPLFSVSGYGAGRPVTSQQTNEEEWKRNRRIDIRFTVKQPRLEDYQKIKVEAL
jgi:flagellar motor protein MotB